MLVIMFMLNCHYEPIETNWGFSIQWTHWSSGTTSLQTLRLQRRQRGVAWRRLTPLVLRWRHLFTDLLLLDATEEMRKPKIQHILPLLVWVSKSFFWFGLVQLFASCPTCTLKLLPISESGISSPFSLSLSLREYVQILIHKPCYVFA